jgi:hypothetical protein
LNLKKVNTHRLSSTSTVNLTTSSSNTQTSTSSENNQAQTSSSATLGHENVSSSSATSGTITSTRSRTPSSNPSISLERTQELELVNEIVEQALVDNLLDGEYYSTNDIELIQNHQQQRSMATRSTSTQSPLPSLSNEDTTLTNPSVNESRDGLENLNETSPGLGSSKSNLDTNENKINILIRFVNEKEMRIQAMPNDTILVLKK